MTESNEPRTWADLQKRQLEERVAFIGRALVSHNGRKTLAARDAGIPVKTLRNYVDDYGITDDPASYEMKSIAQAEE